MLQRQCQFQFRFFREEVALLGHIVSGGGIATDPEMIAAMEIRPRLRNLEEVLHLLSHFHPKICIHLSPPDMADRKGREVPLVRGMPSSFRTAEGAVEDGARAGLSGPLDPYYPAER